MKITERLFFVLLAICFTSKAYSVPTAMTYHDAKDFQVIGQLPGCVGYSRLPPSAQPKVRAAIWGISVASSGLAIRFNSDAANINVRWTVVNNASAPHIAPTAFKGLDLYAYVNGDWQFVGVAKPGGGATNDAQLIDGMPAEKREYLLELPLYDGVSKLEIGVDGTITKPLEQIIDTLNPIVVYGTSITQGACASRPGMMYSALLERHLNREVINLGFSGNGIFEVAFGEYIMSVHPSLVILDCVPNSDSATIMKNAPVLVDYLKEEDKNLPILFMESYMRENAYFKTSGFGTFASISKQNAAIKAVYDAAGKKYKNLYYIPSKNLIGDDHEGTVDGTHATDLGFYRMSLIVDKEVASILKIKRKKKKK